MCSIGLLKVLLVILGLFHLAWGVAHLISPLAGYNRFWDEERIKEEEKEDLRCAMINIPIGLLMTSLGSLGAALSIVLPLLFLGLLFLSFKTTQQISDKVFKPRDKGSS